MERAPLNHRAQKLGQVVFEGSSSVDTFTDPCHLRTGADLASETLCFADTLDDGKSSKEGCQRMPCATLRTMKRNYVVCTGFKLVNNEIYH